MAHYVPARFDEADQTFLPPLRTLGFNPQLKLNDSLLVQSYIEAYDISYPEALRRVEAEVRELRQHLETERSYELNDIGLLHFNEEGKLEFEPCEAGILTPQLYGLSTFEMPLLNTAEQVQKPEQSAISAATATTHDTKVTDEKAITIKISWLRNMVAAAAAIIAFLMIGTPVSNNSKMLQSSLLPTSTPTVTAPARTYTNYTPAADVYMVNAPIVQPAAPVVAPTTPVAEADNEQHANAAPRSKSYCLVLACQVSQRNADAFVNQLQSAGFTDVRITNSKNMRRVVYGSYPTEDDAYEALRDLRHQSSHFKQAWVMKVKE